MNGCTKWVVPITLGAGCFLGGLSFSVLFAFFPKSADEEGLSATEIGLVLGGYELSSVIASALFGTFLIEIGPKFLVVSGALCLGCNVALQGFLDWGPRGLVYLVMSLLIAAFQGVSVTALSAPSTAVLARVFPENFATVVAVMECIAYAATMVGPPVGGILYDVGGGLLAPFAALAILSVLYGLVACGTLPSFHSSKSLDSEMTAIDGPSLEAKVCGHSKDSGRKSSVLSILKIPRIALMAVILLSFFSTSGFYNSTLSLILASRYSLNASTTGLVILLQATMVSFGALFLGRLGDKFPSWTSPLLAAGLLLTACSLLLVGPAPFFFMTSVPLWLIVCLQATIGFGLSAYVITAKIIQMELLKEGFGQTIQTYGLATGMFNTFEYLGLLVGAFVGGLGVDYLGYEETMTVCGVLSLFLAIIIIIEMSLSAKTAAYCKLPSVVDDTFDFAKLRSGRKSISAPIIAREVH